MFLKKLVVVFSLWSAVNAGLAIADMTNEPDGFGGIKRRSPDETKWNPGLSSPDFAALHPGYALNARTCLKI